MINKIRAVIVLLLLALTATACGTAANPDQSGLTYDAGPISDTEFQNCFDPGARDVAGPFDLQFLYPAGERTYRFTGAEDAESDPLTFLSSDRQQMHVSGVLTFSLTTDCEVLQAFHEDIGLKYGASDDGIEDWRSLMNDYLGQALQRGVQVAGADYTWAELANDPSSRDTFERAVVKALPDYISGVVDSGDYFDVIGLTLQQPIPPQQLLDQLREQEVAAEEVNTIDSRQAALNAEQAQIEQLLEIFGSWEAYIHYRNLRNCEDGEEATVCIPMLPGVGAVVAAP